MCIFLWGILYFFISFGMWLVNFLRNLILVKLVLLMIIVNNLLCGFVFYLVNCVLMCVWIFLMDFIFVIVKVYFFKLLILNVFVFDLRVINK